MSPELFKFFFQSSALKPPASIVPSSSILFVAELSRIIYKDESTESGPELYISTQSLSDVPELNSLIKRAAKTLLGENKKKRNERKIIAFLIIQLKSSRKIQFNSISWGLYEDTM